MFNLNPKKMQEAMKKLGIQQEEIPASRVIIEQENNKIIIENPTIVRINMQGQESFQISGDIKEVQEGISQEDIKIVMEKTRKSEKEARQALEKSNGDLSEAILNLS